MNRVMTKRDARPRPQVWLERQKLVVSEIRLKKLLQLLTATSAGGKARAVL